MKMYKNISKALITVCVAGSVAGCGNNAIQSQEATTQIEATTQQSEETSENQETTTSAGSESASGEEREESVWNDPVIQNIQEFSEEFISSMRSGEPSNELIKEYMDNYDEMICLIKEDTDDYSDVYNDEGVEDTEDGTGGWSEEELAAFAEEDRQIRESWGTDDIVQVIDNEPYVNVNELMFDENGIASVTYEGETYIVTRGQIGGFTPMELREDYTDDDFRCYNIVRDGSNTYISYYKSIDDVVTIMLNIEVDEDKEVCGFNVMTY